MSDKRADAKSESKLDEKIDEKTDATSANKPSLLEFINAWGKHKNINDTTKKSGDQKNEKHLPQLSIVQPGAESECREDPQPLLAPVGLDKFSANARTVDNPTIGAEEAELEANVLLKYFDKIRCYNIETESYDFLSAAKITKFVEFAKDPANATKATPWPNAEEIAVLERAIKNIHRIESTSDDEFFIENDGATKADITNFAAQEKEFEDQYQAVFYAKNYLDRIAITGWKSLEVQDIKDYRNLLKTRPEASLELKAVQNLVNQLDKRNLKNSTLLFVGEAPQGMEQDASFDYTYHGGFDVNGH